MFYYTKIKDLEEEVRLLKQTVNMMTEKYDKELLQAECSHSIEDREFIFQYSSPYHMIGIGNVNLDSPLEICKNCKKTIKIHDNILDAEKRQLEIDRELLAIEADRINNVKNELNKKEKNENKNKTSK